MKKENAYLTVYLTLVLVILISLSMTMIYSCANQASRLQVECSTDIGFQSILAEYHRELLEQYDLFFIDTSYGSGQPSAAETSNHLQSFINYNLSSKDIFFLLPHKDLLKLKTEEIQIHTTSVATDQGGLVFRKQAEEYMYDSLLVGYMDDVLNWVNVVESNGLMSRDIAGERAGIEQQISAINGKKIQVGEEEWVTVEVNNPAAGINGSRNSGILSLVIEDASNLSGENFSLSSSLLTRQKNTGSGLNPQKNQDETLIDQMVFQEYLFQKLGNYRNAMEKSYMKYQLEYLIAGKSSDVENLKAVVNRLLLLREVSNVIYIFGDSGKCAAANVLAATVSAVLMVPELQKLLEYSILFAWAFAESIYDVKTLLKGGRIPLMKNEASWYTDLGILTGGVSQIHGSEGNAEGLSYEDYLKVFLTLQNVETKTYRAMDMMELDIKKTPGNESFRFDGCIDSLEATITTKGKYGEYSITRQYGY